MITKEFFDQYKGHDVYKYILKDKNIEVSILNYGATIQSIKVDGIEIVPSFRHTEDYNIRGGYVCGVIGRVANRIDKATFVLNGKTYKVSENENGNQLHGGIEGFNSKFFDSEILDDGIKMTYLSKDGEEGFPGNLLFTVIFKLIDRKLEIEYLAKSDKDTIFAPTHHFYFNLNGPVGHANANNLIIYADGYTPVDKLLIPTGKILSVDNTPFDFRKLRKIDKEKTEIGIYDHNFMLNGNHAATMIGNKTNLKMEIYTDMPAMQMYTGAGGKEKEDEVDITARGGVALEPQFAPNAINMDGFEKPIIKANEEVKHYIRLEF